MEITSKFSKVTRYKINTPKLAIFLYMNNKQSKKETNKTISFTIPSKTIILRNKLNQESKICTMKAKNSVKVQKKQMKRHHMFMD